jgi:tRNA 5-methylaminomethyl-2-thiouridine biosynthesis bifunctional protein
VLQLGFDAAERQRHELWCALSPPPGWGKTLSAAEASAIAGVALPHSALWYSKGGWVHPAALCEAFLSDAPIIVRTSVVVVDVCAGEHRRWRVIDQERCEHEADMVVLATAHDASRLSVAQRMPLKPVRGQLTYLQGNEASARLKSVVCARGYVAPARDGYHSVGATFSASDATTNVTVADHEANLRTLAALSPDLYQQLGGESIEVARLEGRAAVRCVTPDYLPLIGPMMNAEQFDTRYARLTKDATERFHDASPPWQEHLYISTAHGSRGLITAPIAAEIIASIATCEPAPVSASVIEAILPPRFLARALSRRTPKSVRRSGKAAVIADDSVAS